MKPGKPGILVMLLKPWQMEPKTDGSWNSGNSYFPH